MGAPVRGTSGGRRSAAVRVAVDMAGMNRLADRYVREAALRSRLEAGA